MAQYKCRRHYRQARQPRWVLIHWVMSGITNNPDLLQLILKAGLPLSSTTVNSLTHKLSLYRHSSGALVFGAGTVQWSWGLDGAHWGGSTTTSTEMQQATVNFLQIWEYSQEHFNQD